MPVRPNPHPPLMADTWLEYFHGEYYFDTNLLTGHTDATEQVTNALQNILDKAQSFEDLKIELLKFIKERNAFMDDVDKKWADKNPEQWGFPPTPK